MVLRKNMKDTQRKGKQLKSIYYGIFWLKASVQNPHITQILRKADKRKSFTVSMATLLCT